VEPDFLTNGRSRRRARAEFVHIPSDFIIACVPAVEGTLLGDKAISTVFDNT